MPVVLMNNSIRITSIIPNFEPGLLLSSIVHISTLSQQECKYTIDDWDDEIWLLIFNVVFLEYAKYSEQQLF